MHITFSHHELLKIVAASDIGEVIPFAKDCPRYLPTKALPVLAGALARQVVGDLPDKDAVLVIDAFIFELLIGRDKGTPEADHIRAIIARAIAKGDR